MRHRQVGVTFPPRPCLPPPNLDQQQQQQQHYQAAHNRPDKSHRRRQFRLSELSHHLPLDLGLSTGLERSLDLLTSSFIPTSALAATSVIPSQPDLVNNPPSPTHHDNHHKNSTTALPTVGTLSGTAQSLRALSVQPPNVPTMGSSTIMMGQDPSMVFRSSDDAVNKPNKPPSVHDITYRQVILRDRTSVATIIPIISLDSIPESLVDFLCAELNKEIEQGDSYPMSEPLTVAEFAAFWFGGFAAVMIRGEDEAAISLYQAANSEPVRWADYCLGSFFVKPHFPGRSSHVCTGSFLVTTTSRKNGVGRLMGETYLEWAPKLGYTYSLFSLVYEKNTSSCRIWDSLGFKRVGRIKACGHLRSYPDHPVDSIIYGRDLTADGDDDVTEERFDKIKYYLRHGKYPNGADRAEKSRLRSAATHYKLIAATDLEPERLMLKDKEVVAEADRQMEIARQFHIRHNHGGINKTTASLAEKYHWIRIKETVSHVIRICPECNESAKQPQIKLEQTAASAFVHPATVVTPAAPILLTQALDAQIQNVRQQAAQAHVRAVQADHIARATKAVEAVKIAQAVKDAHIHAQLTAQPPAAAQAQALHAAQVVQAQTQAQVMHAVQAQSQAEALHAQVIQVTHAKAQVEAHAQVQAQVQAQSQAQAQAQVQAQVQAQAVQAAQASASAMQPQTIAESIEQQQQAQAQLQQAQIQQMQIEQAFSSPLNVTSQAPMLNPFTATQGQDTAAQIVSSFNSASVAAESAAAQAAASTAVDDASMAAAAFMGFPVSGPQTFNSLQALAAEAELSQAVLSQSSGIGLSASQPAAIGGSGISTMSPSSVAASLGLGPICQPANIANPNDVASLQAQNLLPTPPEAGVGAQSSGYIPLTSTNIALPHTQISVPQSMLDQTSGSVPLTAQQIVNSTMASLTGTIPASMSIATSAALASTMAAVNAGQMSAATAGLPILTSVGTQHVLPQESVQLATSSI